MNWHDDVRTSENFFDVEMIRMHLNMFKSMNETDSKEFKELMFGRKPSNDSKLQLSLFEKILRKPGSKDLINLTWKTFELWTKEFLLNLVSFILQKIQK